MSSASEASRLLGERLRDARQRVGVTQMDLANLAGLNVANYGKLERGLGNPNFETIIRIAGVLGADPGSLIQGIGLDALPPSRPRFTAADFLRERADRGV